MAKYNVLSTKKLNPSLLAQAKQHDINIRIEEAISIRPILSLDKWNEIAALLDRKIEYAVFTSSNAVDALKKYLHTYINPNPVTWKIFCMAGKTKETLQESDALFGTIKGTANNAAALAQQIIGEGVKEVVFFCGNKRRDELPALLQEAGVTIHEVVVYETVATPVVASGDEDAVLFFSPSAVQSFFSVNQLKPQTVCFAIGQTTADSIAAHIHNPIITSETPGQEAMMAMVYAYFQNTNCHK